MNVTAATRVLAIIGDPVGHSLSPQMQNAWIADAELDAIYVALPVRGDAAAFFSGLRAAGLYGANVTVPHKEAAAAAFGDGKLRAANTLVWAADGAISAHNTDGEGFVASLDEGAPDWRPGKNALVLGAGGAALGIVAALRGAGCVVTAANRTRARAEALGADAVVDWSALSTAFAGADLIVNTTTLGMHGLPSMDWPLARCAAQAIIVDIVYRPLETPLLAAARARGLRTIDGLGMLIHQGALAFELWFGVKPDVEAARMRLEAILEEGA